MSAKDRTRENLEQEIARLNARLAASTESETRFRDAFERSTVGQSLTGPDGKLLKVNQAFADILGLSVQELQQASVADITHPDDFAKTQELFRCVLANERTTYRMDKRYKHRAGHIVYADVSVTLLRDQAGAPCHFVTTIVDITDRKLAEAALQQSEALYRSLFENMLNGFAHCQMLFDQGRPVDFIYLNVNDAFMTQTGLRNVVGRKASDVVPGIREGSPDLFEIYGRVATTGRPEVFETYVQALKMWFAISVYSPKREHFVALFDVVTDRKRAEEELRVSERLVKGILDNIQDAYIRADNDGRIIMVSPSAVGLYRYDSMQEMIGLPTVVLYESESERHAFIEELRQQGSVTDQIGVGRRKDGVLFWVSLNARLFHDEKGQVAGAECFVRDITRQKESEIERARLEEQLRASQKMEAIGRLAGGVAHDFNNLLSVIQIYNGFAMGDATDSVKCDLIEVQKATNRGVALVKQLLAFGRKQVLQPVPLNLSKVVARVQAMLRRVLGEDIDLDQQLAPNIALVMADPSQIEQVIMNLVVNARDAMPEGGKLTIETSNVEIDEQQVVSHVPARPGSYVQLVVADTGLGMNEQTREKIFEPFFTTKSSGTGLGLSTVYGIVSQSGGYIWVSSEPGIGTTFKIYLPRATSASTSPSSVPPPTSRRGAGAETILVVEDDEALLKAAKRTLDAAGYTVLTAANGNDAFVACSRHSGDIHLLVTDVVMPQMSGKALADALSNARPILKVLYMSGYTDNIIDQHGVLPEGTHFIGKPFTTADLTRKVREVLDLT
jgi:two-component system cell cycle sensor histidine kinase/response regulator CckA